jgi:hypothetical protein
MRRGIAPSSMDVQERLITEPSLYLEHIKKILNDEQLVLNSTAQEMRKSVDELETNLKDTKESLLTLQKAKDKLEQEQKTNNSAELEEEKQKLETELSNKLTQINQLENSILVKEKEWNSNKQDLLMKLKQFKNNELMPYLTDMNEIMKLTNSKIQASNLLLKNEILSTRFGSSPLDKLKNDFYQKFGNNNDTLFNDNNFGKCGKEHVETRDLYFGQDAESYNEEEDNDEEEMNFGKAVVDDDDDDDDFSEIDDSESESESD